MKVAIDNSSLCQIIHILAESFSVDVESHERLLATSVPSDMGEGKISVCTFRKGLSLFSLHSHFKEELKIHLKQTGPHPLYLIFCKSGVLRHSIDAHFMQYELSSLQTSLSACAGKVEQIFCFKGGMEQVMYVLEIDRGLYLQHLAMGLETLHPQLRRIFIDVESNFPFFYRDYYSVRAAEVLNQMHATKYEGFILHTFLEAKTLELLSLAMSQYTEGQKSGHEQLLLRESDEQSLLEARNIILDNLGSPPSIRKLAVMVGINEFKLKVGYKQLFKTTIYQHIQTERLNRAKALLEEGKWDVGEVAQRVGYINKSHFAAKFKEKFGILPKAFQKSLWSELN